MTVPHSDVRKVLEKVSAVFQEAVINDLHVNFHPDNDFADYITEKDENSFEVTDIKKLNDLNECLFRLLDDGLSPDVYEIGLPILLKAIEKDGKPANQSEKPLKKVGLLGE